MRSSLPVAARWLGAVSLAGAGVIALLGATGSDATPGRATAGRPALPGQHPAAVTAEVDPAPCTKAQPRTAAQWQAAFTALHGQWEGADVASTVALPDGRTLWLFGDTLHRTATGMGMKRNSMLMGERGCLTPVAGRNGGEPLPTRADGHWFWPTHGVVDGGRLFVFATSTTSTGTGSLDFAGTGSEIGVFDLPAGKNPVLVAMRPTPSTGEPETRPQWGAAVVQAGGYTYVYGTAKVNRELVFGRDVYVARVPDGHLGDLTRWQYWDGRSWSPRASSATVVIDAAAGMPTSFSVQPGRSGSVVAIAKKDDFVGDQVMSMSAPSPAGPWGSARSLATSPSNPGGGQVTYLALGHPDLPLTSGGLLVSVSRNNLDLGVVIADPQRYRPRFYDVPMP